MHGQERGLTKAQNQKRMSLQLSETGNPPEEPETRTRCN